MVFLERKLRKIMYVTDTLVTLWKAGKLFGWVAVTNRLYMAAELVFPRKGRE